MRTCARRCVRIGEHAEATPHLEMASGALSTAPGAAYDPVHLALAVCRASAAAQDETAAARLWDRCHGPDSELRLENLSFGLALGLELQVAPASRLDLEPQRALCGARLTRLGLQRALLQVTELGKAEAERPSLNFCNSGPLPRLLHPFALCQPLPTGLQTAASPSPPTVPASAKADVVDASAVARLLHGAERVVVLTGAGVSSSSGLLTRRLQWEKRSRDASVANVAVAARPEALHAAGWQPHCNAQRLAQGVLLLAGTV